MEVDLSPELQAKLERLAEREGRDTQAIIQEAIERLIGYDEWFLKEVQKGIEQINRGETLSHEEVTARIEKRLDGWRNRK